MIKVTLGIDIGGTNTEFGLIDQSGQNFGSGTLLTKSYITPKLLFEELYNQINIQLKKNPDINLNAIGIGAPNGNYLNGTIEYAPNLNWKGIIDLKTILNKLFNVPVFVDNDANLAAIGEKIYGAAKGCDDFILVTLGTGVGSGFYISGNMVYGHDAFAGELGHVIIEPNGRLCGCGRKGCLETYTSATGIVRTAIEMLKRDSNESILSDINKNELTSLDISKAAEKGDKLALEIFNYTADKLGFALANAVAISSPKLIVLFGGLAKAGDLLLKPLKLYFESYLLHIYKNKVSIVGSELEGENVAILGASALAWNEITK